MRIGTDKSAYLVNGEGHPTRWVTTSLPYTMKDKLWSGLTRSPFHISHLIHKA